jgi:hypothetical protein
VQHGHDPQLARKVHIPQARNLFSREQMLKHPPSSCMNSRTHPWIRGTPAEADDTSGTFGDSALSARRKVAGWSAPQTPPNLAFEHGNDGGVVIQFLEPIPHSHDLIVVQRTHVVRH